MITQTTTTAQGLINNGGHIIIAGNANITIDGGTSLGNFTNQDNNGTGIVENAGFLSVSGNWINNSAQPVFTANTGLVNLNGTTQTIGGSASTYFNNLSFTGTGTKTLDVNTQVGGATTTPGTGVLQLNTSNLNLNSHTLTINNNATSAITRTTSATSNMIISETNASAGYGIIKWNIGTSTGNFEFPFGNAASSNYIPFFLNKTTAGSGSGTPHVSIATYPTDTSSSPNNLPWPTGVTNMNNVFGSNNTLKVLDRYWVMAVQGYTAQPTASIAMTYRDSEYGGANTITESTLKAQQWNGTQWLAPCGTINTATNTVTVSSISSFNTVWTLASSSSPLPIELLSFNATLNSSKKVDVTWVTASEINNDYFTIERSSDALNFETVGTVNGAGNSTSELHYAMVDHNPYQGISYYRLKQTDFDGAFTYSQIEKIYLDELSNTGSITTVAVSVFPNPASEMISVTSADNLSGAIIYILNALGQQVKNPVIIQNPSEQKVTIQISELASGIYFLKLEQNGQSIVTRFYKK